MLGQVQVRRRSWASRDHELRRGDEVLATLAYAGLREVGEVRWADGRVHRVRRAPRFGPWELTDADDTVLVSAAKDDTFRERFTLAWDGREQLRLERRANRGRRRLVAIELPLSLEVGEVRQVGLAGRVHELSFPEGAGTAVPDPATALIGWLVGMLALRDTTVAAQQ